MDVYFTIDDIAPSYLQRWEVLEQMKQHCPQLKVNCFTIANKDFVENVSENQEFQSWFERNQDWIQIGVHAYDHSRELRSEVERDYWELRYCLNESLKLLGRHLPVQRCYRPPGHQSSVVLNALLAELGFDYIAHETRIQSVIGASVTQRRMINTHIYDIAPIMFAPETEFYFIGE